MVDKQALYKGNIQMANNCSILLLIREKKTQSYNEIPLSISQITKI